jgi:hypothetical protein
VHSFEFAEWNTEYKEQGGIMEFTEYLDLLLMILEEK